MKQLNLFNKNSTYKISTEISTIYKIIPIGEKCRKNNSKKKRGREYRESRIDICCFF